MRSDESRKITSRPARGSAVVLALALFACHAHATGTANLNLNAQATGQATGEATAEQSDAGTPDGGAPTRTVFDKVQVEFDTDKWDLDPRDKETLADHLDEICNAHAQSPTKKIVVEGHADPRGAGARNMDLSLHRAQSIRDWIASNNKCGIDPSLLVAKAHGEQEPACHDESAHGWHPQCMGGPNDSEPPGTNTQCSECWATDRETAFALEAVEVGASPASAAPPPPPPEVVHGHPRGCGCEAAGLDTEGIGGGVAGVLAGMLVVLRRWRRLRERRAPFVVLPLALACAACGMIAIQETPINSPPAPMTPRDPGKVEMFTAGPPSKPYVEIAMLEAQQQDEYSGDVVAKLREYAAHKGCDGIVVTGSSAREAHNKLFENQTVTLKGYRATCIVYKVDASAPASTSSGGTLNVLHEFDLTFVLDRAELSRDDQKKLTDYVDDLCAHLAQNPGETVEVQGHADSRGAADHNLELSQRRAEAVRSFILQSKVCQVDGSRLTAKGYGEQEPRKCHEAPECEGNDRGPKTCEDCWQHNRMTILTSSTPPGPPR